MPVLSFSLVVEILLERLDHSAAEYVAEKSLPHTTLVGTRTPSNESSVFISQHAPSAITHDFRPTISLVRTWPICNGISTHF
jgi:hypothetical protein